MIEPAILEDFLNLLAGRQLGRAGMSRKVFELPLNEKYAVKIEEGDGFFQNVMENNFWSTVEHTNIASQARSTTMSLDHVLHLVDEFARAMRDQAKQPGSITADDINQQRLQVHEAIRKLAGITTPQEVQATRETAKAIAAAARPTSPAPVTAGLTTDHNDPRLTHGHDETPRPQAEVYVVLSEEERAKGFIRPYRDAYKHDTCGSVTTMGRALSETYARDPKFYGGTYCVKCQMHRPVAEFRWYEMDGTIGPVVGS